MQKKDTKPAQKKKAVKKIIRALPPADPSLTEPQVLDSISMTEWQKPIEQVGSAYEQLKKRYANMDERIKNGASATFTDSEPEEPSSEEEESKEPQGKQDDYEKKRRKRTKEDIEREALEKGDLYAILELEDKTFEAGDNDIRRGYQKLALKFHPDKLGDKITEQDKEMWLKIQDAYETLSDPVKRKRYDSTLPFNDEIPKEGDFTDETFYDVFAAVFNRNAMFAKKKPCPLIGNMDSPMNQVHAFYKYWNDFQTWREFTQYDEYDPTEANDRYERRYMENENKKVRSKYEKKERARLIKLAQMAYNNDPRIKREQELIEAEK